MPRNNARTSESDLADWVRWQQIAYERNELDAGQVQALEAVPKWVWFTEAEKGEIEGGWPGLLDPAKVSIVWGRDGTPREVN
jgi:hypothetical protein